MPDPCSTPSVGHLEREAAIGGYEAADAAGERRSSASTTRSPRCSARDRDEIAVVENATRAWDMAFYAFPFGPATASSPPAAEYASNYIAFLQVARRTGAVVEVIPNDEHGQVST